MRYLMNSQKVQDVTLDGTFHDAIKNNKANFNSQGVFLFYFIGLKL